MIDINMHHYLMTSFTLPRENDIFNRDSRRPCLDLVTLTFHMAHIDCPTLYLVPESMCSASYYHLSTDDFSPADQGIRCQTELQSGQEILLSNTKCQVSAVRRATSIRGAAWVLARPARAPLVLENFPGQLGRECQVARPRPSSAFWPGGHFCHSNSNVAGCDASSH